MPLPTSSPPSGTDGPVDITPTSTARTTVSPVASSAPLEPAKAEPSRLTVSGRTTTSPTVALGAGGVPSRVGIDEAGTVVRLAAGALDGTEVGETITLVSPSGARTSFTVRSVTTDAAPSLTGGLTVVAPTADG